MRKVISGIAGLMCMLLVLFGLIICMCETPDLDKQLTTMLTGVGIMAVGAVIGFLGKGVEEGCIR
jgi:preprotein translocase subunit Sss1